MEKRIGSHLVEHFQTKGDHLWLTDSVTGNVVILSRDEILSMLRFLNEGRAEQEIIKAGGE